jgi:hypothetical protein
MKIPDEMVEQVYFDIQVWTGPESELESAHVRTALESVLADLPEPAELLARAEAAERRAEAAEQRIAELETELRRRDDPLYRALHPKIF